MGAAATATRTSCCEGPRRHARFAHIANRIGCVVGRAVEDALATKVGTADKPERLYSDGPLPPAEHRGCACSACLRRRRSACRSSHSHFRPPPGQRAIVRLIAQVLSFYLCCRHVLEEEARAPSPKDGRAGGGTKPAAARIGEAGMSAFLVNHSVPTQKAVDLVQRSYGPPGLSSSDQVSTIRHIRAQRRPVGRRCSSSNEQTLQSLRMRHAGRTA